jgi:hypothetical protein
MDPNNCPGSISNVSIRVETVRLDDIIKDQPVSFMKIDVEGHEYETLLGTVASVQSSKPVILCEIKPKNLAKIADLANSLKYSLFRSRDIFAPASSDEMYFLIFEEDPCIRSDWKKV